MITKWDKILSMHVPPLEDKNKIDLEIFRKKLREWNVFISKLIEKE